MREKNRSSLREVAAGVDLRVVVAKIVVIIAALGLSGCAHLGARGESAQGVTGNGPGAKTSSQEGTTSTEVKAANFEDGFVSSSGDAELIPLGMNRQVLKWIDYFQGAGRPHMERYLSRSTRYMPTMKAILREQGLPEDLIYIALIESGFSSTAKSTAQAVGYWQFIRGTGRRYGLKIDSYVDERRDFVRSTQAAGQYFKELYEIFHGWYLAVASYNVGENRVKNVITKYRTRDFWQLARENKLPLETSDYVPKFIAARLIARAPEKYGFSDIDYMAPIEFDLVEFSTSIDIRKLAKEMNLEYDDLRDLNPSYKRGVAFEKGGKLTLRVPKGMTQVALLGAAASAAGSKKIYIADEEYGYYKIRRGDTISTIARKFSTTQRTIRSLNKLEISTRLVAGKRLRVPAENVAGLATKEEGAGKKDEKSSPSLSLESNKGGVAKTIKRSPAGKRMSGKPTASLQSQPIHIVKKGDTLLEIAHRYRVSLAQLARRNNISRRTKVAVGTRLEIPQ